MQLVLIIHGVHIYKFTSLLKFIYNPKINTFFILFICSCGSEFLSWVFSLVWYSLDSTHFLSGLIGKYFTCLYLTAAKLFQSCPILCDPMDCTPPDSSVHGICHAGILQWVAVPSSRGSSNPGIKPLALMSPALAGRFFTTSATWEALVYVLQPK